MNDRPTKNQVVKMKLLRKQQRKNRVKSSLDAMKQILLNCDSELITVHRNGPRRGKYHTVNILEMAVDYLTHVRKRIESYQNSKIDIHYTDDTGDQDCMAKP
ncbi:hypothetical protein GWI33_001725 [Rhynchophorus ferrugineus]|uniref:BHLH domain-containing protein n=1 Tax=Rhynchophorus ferrugineus TaxID=354439 RepID=A0A834J3A6_RHYFE|nr:hypothetical protein GWI33_001725 [Rhynchophorus ferrugineus]